MSELRERSFTLELTDEDVKEFLKKCYQDGTTPKEVLEGFINDLICGTRSNGSDERMYAEQYYERVGYSYFNKGRETFGQWLLGEYGEGAIEDVIYSISDKKIFKGEIEYLKTAPKEWRKVRVEELEKEIKDREETINNYYEEYTDEVEKPEKMEEAIESVYKIWGII